MDFLHKYKSMPIETRASIAYTFSSLVSKGVSVITVPIFTRLLTSAEVGVGTTYSAWYSVLYAIATLSLCSGSLNIGMMEYKDRRNDYEASCLTLSSISCLAFADLCFVFRNLLLSFTQLSYEVLTILVISLIINPALDFWYARQRYEYKYISSVAVSTAVTVLSAVVSIACILNLKDDVSVNLGDVKVVSQGCVLIFFSFVAYLYIMLKGRAHFDFIIWKFALKLSLPLIVHSLAGSLLNMSDRLMIASMCGQSEAGIYGTVYSLAMLSLIVWNAINTSLIPYTFEKLEKNEEVAIRKTCQGVLMIFGTVAIVVTLFAPEILLIFTTEEYFSAVNLVPALSAGVYYIALYNIYGNFLLFKKKTTYIMSGTMTAAILNIILNYIFIRAAGYTAAAYTTLASYIVLAIMQALLCRKAYGKIIINDIRIFIFSGAVVVLCLLCNFVYDFVAIRYGLIFALCICCVIKRKTIINYLRF